MTEDLIASEKEEDKISFENLESTGQECNHASRTLTFEDDDEAPISCGQKWPIDYLWSDPFHGHETLNLAASISLSMKNVNHFIYLLSERPKP